MFWLLLSLLSRRCTVSVASSSSSSSWSNKTLLLLSNDDECCRCSRAVTASTCSTSVVSSTASTSWRPAVRSPTNRRSVCLSVCYTLYSAGHYASKTCNARDTTIGHSRSYPKVWNTLPLNVRQISNTQTLKRNLKTFLFCTSYNIPTPTLSPAD